NSTFFTNNGTLNCTPCAGSVQFFDTSTAGNGTFTYAGADTSDGPPAFTNPEKFVLRLLLPTVRLRAPRNTSPLPWIEPMDTPGGLWPLMSRKPLPKTFTRAWPPLESLKNRMLPPPSPISVPLSIVNVPFSAVEASLKETEPP